MKHEFTDFTKHGISIIPDTIKSEDFTIIFQEPIQFIMLGSTMTGSNGTNTRFLIMISRHGFRRSQFNLFSLGQIVLSEFITIDNSKGLAIKSNVDTQIEIRNIVKSSGRFWHFLSFDQDTLRNTTIFYRRLHDRDGIIFQKVQNTYTAQMILFQRFMNSFLEVSIKSQDHFIIRYMSGDKGGI